MYTAHHISILYVRILYLVETVNVWCLKFPEICFCQELAKLEDISLSYDRDKKGDIFLWDAVYIKARLWLLGIKY